MEKIVDAYTRASLTAQAVYQLGYYPEDEHWEGQYRQIDIRVTRPGTKVLFRQGYYAGDTLPPPEVEEPIARHRIAAAVAEGSDLNDLPFKISTATAKDPGGKSQIKVDLQIDPIKVGFKTVNDRHAGRLRIAIFHADAKGNYLGEDWKTMALQLKEESYQRILRSKIPFSTLIPLGVGLAYLVFYYTGESRRADDAQPAVRQ